MMKKLFALLVSVFLCSCLVLSASAQAPLVVDNANLLTSSEEAILDASLEETGEELGIDVVVLTVDSLGGKTARAYADDYYDYNGYSYSGILLLVSMSEREWYITTSGSAMSMVSDAEVNTIGNRVATKLGQGNYLDAFLLFSESVSTFATGGSVSSSRDPIGWLICIGIGIAVGLIVVLIMKGQLKSVRSQNTASGYQVSGSFGLTQSHELFLFRNVSRTRRAESSGGGSHRGSSGRSHGGGGGRF